MRFGVVLPTYPTGATVDGIVRVAEAAERLGFGSVWTTDHVIMQPEEAGPYGEIFEAVTTLAFLAAISAKVKLELSVLVVPQRNGVVLAKELATLDRLSGGPISMRRFRSGGTSGQSRKRPSVGRSISCLPSPSLLVPWDGREPEDSIHPPRQEGVLGRRLFTW
ncbi:MAG: LLM class flavin-dependent oxidoreductase [Opitutaceae bacterium]